ncbi:MAG: site-specific integrase, partial [Lachnospiraceae bacterium]|nr:site-specific integrase [Lachnospiraceae bacterium]
YKKLLAECGLPNIRWHDLRATFCTLLVENKFSPKAISKLLGNSTIVAQDFYTDTQRLIADCIPEMEEYYNEILPDDAHMEEIGELTDVVIELGDIFPENKQDNT